MSLYSRLQTDMQKALKARDRDTVRTLRTLLAKLKERAIAKGEELSEKEEIKVIHSATKQRKEAIEMYIKGGRQDLVRAERGELEIIQSYLPQQLTKMELVGVIDRIIQETNAESLRDMGKVMPLVMQQVSGRADGKAVQQIVREKLS